MSGTSMDGVDISLIKTDGYDYFDEITDKYYEFDGSWKLKSNETFYVASFFWKTSYL